MKENSAIYLICADLGYKVFDQLFVEFPERVINSGAAEQSALDVAIGLALDGKIPFVYSITPFLLYRPFEALRTYIDYEKIPVKLVGSGRNNDYKHDGFSHFAGDDKKFLNCLSHIKKSWPKTKEEIPYLLNNIISDGHPHYLNLTR